MKTFTKLASGAALACALVLPTASPAIAGDDGPIVVKSQAAMEEWQEKTTRHLNRALAFNPTNMKLRPNNGVVQVSFTMDENGRAQDIALYKSSGNGTAQRIAKRAVRHLRTLDEVPVANRKDARFLANIIFADNPEIKQQLLAKLAASERTRLASAGASRQYIALGN